VSTHYVSGNMAVAGVGIDHDTLVELVQKMPVREGAKPAVMQKAKYYGGTVKYSSITTEYLYLISTFRSQHEIFVRRSWYSVLPSLDAKIS